MNREQILGLIRQILPFVGGYLVTKGYISEEGFAAISDDLVGAAGVVIALASGLWSMMDKTDKSIMEKAVALPDEKKADCCAAIAASVPDRIMVTEREDGLTRVDVGTRVAQSYPKAK